ncbi:MAG TPA: metallophosphoesterase [Bacteroidia bacterium]|jgi:predicted MPP superfamily phosphohydrolase|nr:metallophosphoesterase [Bacteroidia bacterium]
MISAAKIYSTIAIVLLILVLIDVYVYFGLRTILSSSSKKVKAIASWIYWTINAAFIALTLYTAYTFSPYTGGVGSTIRLLAASFVLLYVPKLFYIVFLLLEDVYRLLRCIGVGIYKLVEKDKATDVRFFESRRKFVGQMGALIAGIPFISIIYGETKGKYNFKIHKVELSFKDLPKQFDGLTITQISDIHSGSFDDREEVKRAVKMANGLNSDIMFFTGDLVNNRSDEMDTWMDVFKELKAPMGVYSILGNHDYGDYVQWTSIAAKEANMEKLYRIHKELGYRLMRNENLKIERNGASIELIGIENWGRGGFSKYGDFNKALVGTSPDSFKILLSHDPTQWEEQVMNHPQQIHLTLSGHTHGAQFGVEIAGIKISPVQLRYKRWAGLYLENNRYLYVNRGLGFIGFPGRVGIWPEITSITLKSV